MSGKRISYKRIVSATIWRSCSRLCLSPIQRFYRRFACQRSRGNFRSQSRSSIISYTVFSPRRLGAYGQTPISLQSLTALRSRRICVKSQRFSKTLCFRRSVDFSRSRISFASISMTTEMMMRLSLRLRLSLSLSWLKQSLWKPSLRRPSLRRPSLRRPSLWRPSLRRPSLCQS